MEAPTSEIRLLLTVQYDGGGFHGWQLQPDRRTVQGELEGTIGRLADRPVTVLGSGRTDTGVHATGQVATVDVPAAWTPEKLHRALDALLPADVWVDSVRRVRSDFHPRFDAIARTYVYRVGTHASAASPFHRRWCWPLGERLDVDALSAAAAPIVGRHSFEAFAKSGQPERGDVCTVSAATWSEWQLGPSFSVTADRYLHHMVRYLVGTMVDVARGRRPFADIPSLLAREPGPGSALVTSPPAPPEGLFLSHVEYPADALLEGEPSVASPRSIATV
ncbi:MAG: tRNA pseudouridine(38-40) synthase TruA [Gemmatimonadetes bacterium]|nr:tRNA pseudouridine(38-40) synthase TruA [Gemmatimonadota bacterium]